MSRLRQALTEAYALLDEIYYGDLQPGTKEPQVRIMLMLERIHAALAETDQVQEAVEIIVDLMPSRKNQDDWSHVIEELKRLDAAYARARDFLAKHAKEVT